MKTLQKVVLVDDDNIFLMTARFSIHRVYPQADVQSFNDAEEALAYVLSNSPDLLLLDLNMPVIDGWSFLEAVRNGGSTANFPIYIVSSSIDPADVQRAESHPCVKGFVEKPLNAQKVELICN
ncbi:response regulator [Phaeodactylibacter luteus]|uniref:Response regulator n=1 Tax=Phaeodactylibacter luteus TaxID=1564516 RepID=A0A5C6RI98_9BACT|nr:response regulator [Phaeodactylibacter luteus]TXB60074.1 response regulator [Phaeodactylibacter luteus]